MLRAADDKSARVMAVGDKDDNGGIYSASCAQGDLESLMGAFGEAECVVESITSADYAWSAAIEAIAGPEAGIIAIHLVEHDEVRLLSAADGRPIAWRRLPVVASDGELAHAMNSLRPGEAGDAGAILPLGDAAFRQRVSAAGQRAGLRAVLDDARLAALNHEPLAVAAAFCGTGPRFVPPEVVAHARRRTRRHGFIAAAAAAILALLAGVADLSDHRSEIASVRSSRAGHAAAVNGALRATGDWEGLRGEVGALQAVRGTTPRWTLTLTALGDGIPEGAHIRGLRAAGDTLSTELAGQGVSATIDGLNDVPWWTGLRPVGAPQTVVGDDGQVDERITLTARLAWDVVNETERRTP